MKACAAAVLAPAVCDAEGGGAWAEVDLALVESQGLAVVPVAGLGDPNAKLASFPRANWNLLPGLLINEVGWLVSFAIKKKKKRIG